MKLLLHIAFILMVFPVSGQTDTVNFKDFLGKKQGHWIFYGIDRPESGILPEGKVEEGNYIDDKKEGLWIKYHNDGKTPKLKGEYKNNRPDGNYVKFWPNGEVRDSGNFSRFTGRDSLTRGGYHDYPVYIFSNPQTLQSDSVNSITDTDIPLPPIPENPNARGLPFKPNSYNKIYNSDDEIWQEGVFKDGRLQDGRTYVYDRDGILLAVRIFKNGVYHSEGKL